MDLLLGLGEGAIKAMLQWGSVFLLIVLGNLFGFSGVVILSLRLSSSDLVLSGVIVVVLGGLVSLLSVLNFYAVHGFLKSIQNAQRRKANLAAINSVMDKRKGVGGGSSSLDLVYVELMEHYLKAEINQDIADLREATERKRKFLKRFYY